MGKKPRDKTKVRKTKTPPTPNNGPVKFNLWLMPEPKEKGSIDKWGEPTEITGRNRRSVSKELRQEYQGRGWKLRLI